MNPISPDDRPRPVAPYDGPTVPPAFFDDGHEGTWLEHCQFLPWTTALTDGLANAAFFKALDDAGCRLPDGDGIAPVSPFHVLNDSPEEGL